MFSMVSVFSAPIHDSDRYAISVPWPLPLPNEHFHPCRVTSLRSYESSISHLNVYSWLLISFSCSMNLACYSPKYFSHATIITYSSNQNFHQSPTPFSYSICMVLVIKSSCENDPFPTVYVNRGCCTVSVTVLISQRLTLFVFCQILAI